MNVNFLLVKIVELIDIGSDLYVECYKIIIGLLICYNVLELFFFI